MIRFLLTLLLSSAGAQAASPFWYAPTTNELKAVAITPVNVRNTAFTSGSGLTNGFDGAFWIFDANSTWAADGTNIISPNVGSGKWHSSQSILRRNHFYTNDTQYLITSTLVGQSSPTFHMSVGGGMGWGPGSSGGDVSFGRAGVALLNVGGSLQAQNGFRTGGMSAGRYLRDNGTDFVGSLILDADLGSGSSITTKFLRGDRTWQTISGAVPADLSVGTGISITAGTGTGATLQAVTLALNQGVSPTWTAIHNWSKSSQNEAMIYLTDTYNSISSLTKPVFSIYSTYGGVVSFEVNSGGSITAGTWNGQIIGTTKGGLGINAGTPANGTLPIGNGSAFTMAAITAGNGITVANGAGTIALSVNQGANFSWTGEHTHTDSVLLNETDLQFLADTVASTTIFVDVTGDSSARWALLGDGRTLWGPGTGGQDTELSRIAAGVLSVNGVFSAVTGFRVNNAATSGNYLRGNGTDFVSSAIQAADISTSLGASPTRAIWSKTATTTVANTGADTTVLDTGVGTKTVAANYVRAGSVVRINVWGSYGTKTLTPGAIFITYRLGSASCAVTLSGLPANVGGTGSWKGEGSFTFRTIGASATCVGNGEVTYNNAVATDGFFGAYGTLSSDTVDTTGTLAANVTAQWATSDAANTISCTQATIEIVNN